MPKGVFDHSHIVKPEEYEKEDSDMTRTRMEMIVRQISYLQKEAEMTGTCDHDKLKAYVDALLYSSMKWEEKILKNSEHRPVCRPPKMHGNEEKTARRMKINMERFYATIREKAIMRVNENG